MTKNIGIAWLAAGGMIAATGVAAFAHGGATGIVGERMMGMMMLGEQVKLLTPLLADQRPVSPGVIRDAAGMIKMHAGSAMTDLFPAGSIESPSEARPEIWERWQEFLSYADRLAELGAELEQSTTPTTVAVLPEIAPAALVEEPELSEWERMDFASLIGLAPAAGTERSSIDSLITASISEATSPQAPAARSPQAVFADITATCSSCHAAFRR